MHVTFWSAVWALIALIGIAVFAKLLHDYRGDERTRKSIAKKRAEMGLEPEPYDTFIVHRGTRTATLGLISEALAFGLGVWSMFQPPVPTHPVSLYERYAVLSLVAQAVIWVMVGVLFLRTRTKLRS